MMAPLKISVIIPAFNEERLIGDTLRSINDGLEIIKQRGWETELLVCDNNSSDRTGEIARAAGATVVFEPMNQIARARNRGAQAATGDWLLFVDADSHPSRELLGDVMEQILSGHCLAGGSTMRLDGDSPAARRIGAVWNWISRRWRLMAGSFIFCESAAFRAVGGFSNELFVAEELDLSKKLKRLARKRGKRVVILHKHPLVTSARKMHLYSLREHLGFLIRAVLLPGTMRRREACFPWYDGRR
jgi:glycosyltransferase involved in cell wall biosynthesis